MNLDHPYPFEDLSLLTTLLLAWWSCGNDRSKCPFEEVPCKYAGIGCEEELPRKDLKEHENNDAFHLHLAIETINEQQVKKRSCTFKTPEFRQLKSYKTALYSPPFYTHSGGYKMCIRVDANGYDDAPDTHVSVYAYLTKGMNDDNLSWPFTGEVTITLLNQLADENHHTRSVCLERLQRSTKAWHLVLGHESLTCGHVSRWVVVILQYLPVALQWRHWYWRFGHSFLRWWCRSRRNILTSSSFSMHSLVQRRRAYPHVVRWFSRDRNSPIQPHPFSLLVHITLSDLISCSPMGRKSIG